jgi:uncharacterized protein YjbI with pentapeptide repeats
MKYHPETAPSPCGGRERLQFIDVPERSSRIDGSVDQGRYGWPRPQEPHICASRREEEALRERRLPLLHFRHVLSARLRFDSCDFTGCRFTASNFYTSTFSDCKFEYAVFERTLIESDILDTECPGPDNLKLKFARTLRMNYQQLGDAKSANKAISVELQATKQHLSKESVTK